MAFYIVTQAKLEFRILCEKKNIVKMKCKQKFTNTVIISYLFLLISYVLCHLLSNTIDQGFVGLIFQDIPWVLIQNWEYLKEFQILSYIKVCKRKDTTVNFCAKNLQMLNFWQFLARKSESLKKEEKLVLARKFKLTWFYEVRLKELCRIFQEWPKIQQGKMWKLHWKRLNKCHFQ